MAPFDVDRFRLPKRPSVAAGPDRSTSMRSRVRFLKGPVPLPWLEAAAKLPGKSMHAGVALWYLAGLRGSREVALSNVLARQFGLDRNAKRRALAWLEAAELIQVVRQTGRAPSVRLRDKGPT